MSVALWRRTTDKAPEEFRASCDQVQLRTDKAFQVVDLTELLAERVRRARIATGLASLQVLHTTAALLVNENEPLLIQDLERTLERLSPRKQRYAHDDFSRREDVAAAERVNGHAHCKAMTLAPSICLHVAAGRLVLGSWQRILLVELDGAQERRLTVVILGMGPATTCPAEEPCASSSSFLR
jgi:secondary thiamine-phosphate synthase enzyme